jgi:hypothetical protein
MYFKGLCCPFPCHKNKKKLSSLHCENLVRLLTKQIVGLLGVCNTYIVSTEHAGSYQLLFKFYDPKLCPMEVYVPLFLFW